MAVYAASDLHLTLAFLGEVEEVLVRTIVRSAGDEFRGLTAPELRVGGTAGSFPDGERPRALWEGVEETFESMGRLAALRNRALQVAYSHGLRPRRADRERPFRPHVTVARPGREAAVPEDFFEDRDAGRWLPVDVTLFESLGAVSAGGDRYRVLGRLAPGRTSGLSGERPGPSEGRLRHLGGGPPSGSWGRSFPSSDPNGIPNGHRTSRRGRSTRPRTTAPHRHEPQPIQERQVQDALPWNRGR